MRILFPEKDAFPAKHYFNKRSFGWTSWCATFKEALIAAGAEVVPSPKRTGYIVEFQEGGKSCRALIDYSSHPMPFNMKRQEASGYKDVLKFNCDEDYDFILALKYDRRYLDLYELFGPVEPAGYIAFNSQARSLRSRWDMIEDWRMCFDALLTDRAKRRVLFCRMGTVNSKRGVTSWGGPSRSQQLQQLQRSGVPLDGPGPRVEWSEYMKLLLTSTAGLDLPGWGEAICYRTLEYACIGIPIISAIPLHEMILPWGKRWESGVNFLHVDFMDQVPEAFTHLCQDEELYLRLMRESRELFDSVFRPEPTGRWWIETARKYLK